MRSVVPSRRRPETGGGTKPNRGAAARRTRRRPSIRSQVRAYHLEEDAYDVVDEDEPNRIISLAAARVLRLTAPVEDGELQKGDQVRAALLCVVCLPSPRCCDL